MRLWHSRPGKFAEHAVAFRRGARIDRDCDFIFHSENEALSFCILDEIEAALDDANVSRYAQYLKKFAEETQFIVITHRKGTMEHADVLYGVTMQEKGISKLISVDFSEAEKSITA